MYGILMYSRIPTTTFLFPPLFNPPVRVLVDDTEIVDNIQLGETVKVEIDYGRELASNYVLKIDDCSLVSTKQSLALIEKTQVRQLRV